jgi:sporulation protein YlmC with PRC-barrel domain
MRLSDLLGCAVHDHEGVGLGTVTDVRLAQAGRIQGLSAELLVESLLVSPRNTGSLFGYERRAEQGPWLVRALVRGLHKNAFRVPWNDVADWDPSAARITLAPDHHRQDPSLPPGTETPPA